MFEQLPLDVMRKIDRIARGVERQWRRGETPRVEDFLHELEAEGRTALLEELLLLEVGNRRQRGEALSASDFVARFPDAAEIIRKVLDECPREQGAAAPNIDRDGQRTRRFPQIPGYQIIRQLGRGAMGVVYLARQERLSRLVALKTMAANFNLDQALAVIRAEAEVIARLNHPHIVQVFEVGDDQNEPFLALEYIAGETLRERITRQPFPAREAATLVEQLARAMHHAHGHGIVHRDLKPANVLLSADSGVLTPKITDFGLAKVLDAMQEQTQAGAMLGTPKYMAPEQATGRTREVGPATDIYALGTILFELLATKAPFDSDSSLDLLRQIAFQEPVFPGEAARRVSLDLQAICLKCLEKNPSRRYESAWQLADDLRRFLDGFPVEARPPSRADLLLKLVRRNKLASAFVATTVALLILATSISMFAAININHSRIEASRQAANLALDRGLSLCEQGDVAPGLLWMARSLEYSPTQDADLQRVVRVNLASWSKLICPLISILPHQAGVTSVACHDEGNIVLTGCADKTAKLWDSRTGRLIALLAHGDEVTSVALSPDGKLALTGSKDKTARLWNSSNGLPVEPPLWHDEGVTSVAFRADGRVALTGSSDTFARQWDVSNGKLLGGALHHGTAIILASFVGDGRQVVTFGGTQAKLWDADACRPIGGPLEHSFPIRSAMASLDGKTLLTGGGSDLTHRGEARVWELESIGPLGQPIEFDSIVSCVALSPDGRLAFAGSQSGEIRLWNVVSGTVVNATVRHEREVRAAAFSPDGKRILTGSFDGTAKMWNASTGEPLGNPMRHGNHVFAVAFGPNGQSAVSGSLDGKARHWNVARSLPPYRLLREESQKPSLPWSMRIQFSPDGRLVLTGDQFGVARLWSVESGQPYGSEMTHPDKIAALSYRPDGKSIGIGCSDGTVKFWDVASQSAFGGGTHRAGVTEIIYSPDGRVAVSTSHDATAKLWDAASGMELCAPLQHPQDVWSGSFSHDSRLLLTGCGDGIVREWEVATGRVTGRQLHHPHTPWEVEFSRSHETVLTGCGPSAGGLGEARLWDVKSGQLDFRTLPHSGAVAAVAWSPDERFVLTGSFDRTAQLWNAKSGKPASAPFIHRDRVWDTLFSPDGDVVLTASDDHTVRLWDVHTGKALGAPFVHPAPVRNAAFSSDNVTIGTGAADDSARLWSRTRPLTGDVRRIQHWVRTITGLELDAIGVTRQLDGTELEKINRELRGFGPYSE